jgi:hypothetical protein
LKDGDVIKLPSGLTITIGPNSRLPAGTAFALPNGHPATVPTPKQYVALGVYPATYFSIAGPIPQANNAGYMGGTKTVGGVTFSGAFGLPFHKGNQLVELGGFYFRTYDGSADLYQIDLRAMATKELGLQVAFLDSTHVALREWSLHGIYDLNSLSLNPALRHPWDLMFGVGFITDGGRSALNSQNNGLVTVSGYSDRSSVNFSAFINGSLEIARNTSLLLSYWYVRDRNADNNRVSLGIGYKF